eukprot:tig00021434_g21364.t1
MNREFEQRRIHGALRALHSGIVIYGRGMDPSLVPEFVRGVPSLRFVRRVELRDAGAAGSASLQPLAAAVRASH